MFGILNAGNKLVSRSPRCKYKLCIYSACMLVYLYGELSVHICDLLYAYTNGPI